MEDKNIKNFVIVLIICIIIMAILNIIVLKRVNNSFRISNSIVIDEEVENNHINVAQVGNKYYLSLQEAVNSVKENEEAEIILLSDDIENITISDNKIIDLNLNENILESNTANPVICIENDSKLIIYNGTVKQSQNNSAIENHGIAELKENINIEALGSYATIYNSEEANLIIYDGKIENTSSNAAIGNYGYLKVLGGKMYSFQNNNTIWNSGTLEITETAYIESENYPAVYNLEGGSIKISGGEIVNLKSGNAISNCGNLEIIDDASIFSQNKPAIYNQQKGFLNITGGEIKGSNSNSICNYGELKISRYIRNSI